MGCAVKASSLSTFHVRFLGWRGAMARKRTEYSAEERKDLWDRWKHGESISDIGGALDRAPGTIHCTIAVTEAWLRRSRLALTLGEREESSRGVAGGDSAGRIAARLGRSTSTATGELIPPWWWVPLLGRRVR
jgi:Helix-turn-helix domain